MSGTGSQRENEALHRASQGRLSPEASVDLTFLHGSSHPRMIGLDHLSGIANYLVGRERYPLHPEVTFRRVPNQLRL